MNKEGVLDMIDTLRAEVEHMGDPPMVPPSDRVPMQPIVRDERGTIRFRANLLVSYLLDFAEQHGCSMNTQFAQLIGYSVSGYGDLSYALGVDEADEAAERLP